MSAAAAAEAPPPAKGKKKLIIIIAVAAIVLLGAGGGAFFMMKKKAAAEAEAEGGDAPTAHKAPPAAAKKDPKALPVFVPLEPFTVNLADRNADRYAQVGITLEVEDNLTADQIKNYMPAIRNNILMLLADRTAGELMGRDGKSKLAERMRKETSRALGVEIEEEEEEAEAAEDKPKADAKPKKKKKKPAAAVLPIKAVHFSNFIIQ
jgi:flagellar protein FliL